MSKKLEKLRKDAIKTLKTLTWPTASRYYRRADGALHREVGPAIETPALIAYYSEGRRHGLYADRLGAKPGEVAGTVNYYYRGVLIPRRFWESPETLTFEDVVSEKNSEVRYVAMILYGYERALKEGHLKVIDTYQKGVDDYTLLEPAQQVRGMEFRLVRVLNNTIEADGSRKPYFIPVPPDSRTARAAVAWTFRRKPDEYAPRVQT